MKFDVKHIAKLANLTISSDEEKKFETQLEGILTYVEKLNEIDTENGQAINQITGLENVTRDDTTAPSLTQEAALSGTKNTHNGFFKVKGILDNE